MRPRMYSLFWLGYAWGLLALSPEWAARDAPDEHPAEALTMERWMRLPDRERAAIVVEYAFRRPPARYVTTKERRHEAGA